MKNMRIKSTSNKDLGVFIRVTIISKIPKNSNQNMFPSLSQTLYYQPRVLVPPILFNIVSTRPQTNRNSMHLTFASYASMHLTFVRPFEFCSAKKFLQHVQTTTSCCFKWPWKALEHKANKTQHHKLNL